MLVAHWRIFKRPIRASNKTVQSITGGCVCLRNYLQTTQTSSYSLQGFIDIESFDETIKERDWRKTVRSDGAFTSFTKTSGTAVGLCKKNMTSRKVLVFT